MIENIKIFLLKIRKYMNIKNLLGNFKILLIKLKHIVKFILNRYKYIINNIITNSLFYFTICLCLYAISYKFELSYIVLLLSLIYIANLGYFIHWLSHKISFLKIFKSINNVITTNYFMRPFFIKLCEFLDFHHFVHHDTTVNKKKINVIIEFLGNVCTQGIFFIIIQWFIKQVDFRICILWSFAYATVHNINYEIIKPVQHEQHHKNVKTNFGLDILDILYRTKYDTSIENYNHMSINFIVITCLILYFT